MENSKVNGHWNVPETRHDGSDKSETQRSSNQSIIMRLEATTWEIYFLLFVQLTISALVAHIKKKYDVTSILNLVGGEQGKLYVARFMIRKQRVKKKANAESRS